MQTYSVVLFSNGVDISEYKIVYSKNALQSTLYAGKESQKYMEKATGDNLERVNDLTSETDYGILFGRNSAFR